MLRGAWQAAAARRREYVAEKLECTLRDEGRSWKDFQKRRREAARAGSDLTWKRLLYAVAVASGDARPLSALVHVSAEVGSELKQAEEARATALKDLNELAKENAWLTLNDRALPDDMRSKLHVALHVALRPYMVRELGGGCPAECVLFPAPLTCICDTPAHCSTAHARPWTCASGPICRVH